MKADGTFVLVDRNAIHENDHRGTDRPPIVVYSGPEAVSSCHDLEIFDLEGRLVAQFRSQSLRRPVRGDRPHVWFELVNGSLKLRVAGQ